ncbi:MAG: CinA family nicotinamide mononucleotide deamidase-related protein, partial [Verrucomicrobiota bacterium]
MSKPIVVEVINFGDELLIGIRENAHLLYLGERLARYGLPITRSRVITDEPGEIEQAFHDAWTRSDLVITTGGLGPTADDLTRETIGRALGVEMVFDSGIESAIRDRFALLGRTMSPRHSKQCYVFENGEVLHNERGTAPGLFYEAGGKVLAMLPGPANELRPMFEEELLPRLRSKGWLSEDEAYVQIRTCGAGESAVEESLQPVVGRNPDLTVAYCVHSGMVDVRLSSRNGGLDRERLKVIAQEARMELGEDFVCFGHCSLAEVVFHELRALDRTLAVAESCTGGLLGDAFTNIPGASKAFKGGIICYTNEVKMALLDVPECLLDQHGAVSPECAVAMASGAAEKLSADYGLSLTGYVGPGGGDAENPVGTIHLGYHSPVGVWCKTVHYVGGRLDVKARAVNAALDWMR